MTSYRFCFILCKIVALSLWVGAATGLVSTLILTALNLIGWSPIHGIVTVTSWLPQGLVALVLGAVTPALSASLAGQPVLEGESIQSRHTLAPAEKSWVRAGAGLIALIFGLIGAIPLILLAPGLRGAVSSLFAWSLGAQLLGIALHVGVGFWLAFGTGLRRTLQNV